MITAEEKARQIFSIATNQLFDSGISISKQDVIDYCCAYIDKVTSRTTFPEVIKYWQEVKQFIEARSVKTETNSNGKSSS